jgi:Tol biopolymer transport system component
MLLGIVLLLIPPEAAWAAFPGQPGKIVFDDAKGEACESERIFTMNPNGSGRRELATGMGAKFSPNGRQIVFTSCKGSMFGQIWAMGADGSDPHEVIAEVIAGDHSLSSPSFSPDGSKLVFLRDEGPGGRDDVWTARADGTHLRRLTDTPHASESCPSYSANGHLIVFASSGDKRASRRHLFTIHPDGSHLRELGPGSQPSTSPDGRLIAYVRHSGIWVMGINGRNAHSIKPQGGPPGAPSTNIFRNFQPTFSPDGRRILFDRETELRPQGPLNRHVFLWTMRLDGRRVQEIPVDLETAIDEYRPDWQAR